MTSRAFRPTIATLCILLILSGPVHAGPVVVDQVVQVFNSHQAAPTVSIRNSYESSSLIYAFGQGGAAKSLGTSGPSADTVLGGIVAVQQQTAINVTDYSDVDATICDCGEIPIAGGFPKWPLLFLATPLVLIHGSKDTPPSTPLPTPTVPPSATPEPATLFLLGTGLAAVGAQLRRRRKTAALTAAPQTNEEN